MVQFTLVVNAVTIVLWTMFIIYLLINKKSVTINMLGLMLATSVVYPYIIIYDVMHDFQLNPNLKYEILVCRILVLATFYSSVNRGRKLNKDLTKISKRDNNLLKPKE